MPRTHKSRREFLATTGGLALVGSAPAILGAEDKSGSRLPVIGPEGHQYEVHHNCMQVPEHIRWQDTHGVAVALAEEPQQDVLDADVAVAKPQRLLAAVCDHLPNAGAEFGVHVHDSVVFGRSVPLRTWPCAAQ